MARSCSEDVLSDVLCRLRVKSLKRFQCVCKSWYALIRRPSFVTKHLRFHSRQNKNNRSFLLSHSLYISYEFPPDERKDTRFSLVHLEETADDIVFLDWIKFSDNSKQGKKFPDYWYEYIEVFGPRNGIYCLHESSRDHGHVIALMNVSSREFKLVPKPEESIISHTGFRSPAAVEIGFDPKTNDYKVFFFKDCSFLKEGYCQAAVYHLNSNSWKKLSDPLLDHAYLYSLQDFNTDTYVNRNVHWLAFEPDHAGHCCGWYILSFDMVGEVLAKIELPADLRIYCDETLYVVAVFNESLSLIVYPRTPDRLRRERSYTKCFDIWVMKDYGNERSWTKEFTTGPVEDADRLLGIWRNGEFLIKHKNGYTISYDPVTQKMEQLCFGEGLYLNKSCIYSESLVSVTGNAPSDYEIVVEDFPFVVTPDIIERILDNIEKCPSCTRLSSD
ncbi:hypothetical protein ACLB2K_005546 [Fragaria x ananassa]